MNAKDLAKQAGITYRQMDHWCNLGLLGPLQVGPSTGGRGKERVFTVAQRARLLDIAELVHLGLQPPRAAELLDAMQGGVLDKGRLTLTLRMEP